MQLSNGHKLQDGKYRIEKKIGQGGFGITYLARWYQKAQGAVGVANVYSIVVIKEFFWSKYCNRDADGHTVSISSAEGKEMMAQFKEKLKKEGKIISRLSHPNIVGILDIFEENNTAYLVMQYIEGESLKDKIARMGKIDETTVLEYARQICSALTEIHGKRILHLDIKPSNVLIDEDDKVQLIDFGISKQYDETARETSDTPLGVSAGYSPMEQYGTLRSFSPPTDIYAVGATLYKMLTGETPLEATARNQFDLEPVTHFSPNIGKKTEEAIAKAMSEKVRDRFQTTEEFWKALNKKNVAPDSLQKAGNTKIDLPQKEKIEIIRDETKIEKQPVKVEKPKQPAPPQPPVIDPEPEESNSWKKILIGVGAAIAVFAAVFYFYSGKSENTSTVNPTGYVATEVPSASPDSTVIPAAANEPVSNRPQPTSTVTPATVQPDTKKEDVAKLLQQANSVFNDTGLGLARYDRSFQLYKKAKGLGGDVSTGYSNFLSKAQSLIGGGSGLDENVKNMLLYAQQLNNTQDVRDLLAKYK